MGLPNAASSPLAKVLVAYREKANATLHPAAVHAVNQILKRIKWLVLDDGENSSSHVPRAVAGDYAIEGTLRSRIDQMSPVNLVTGARPNPVIFDRPLLRCRAPRKDRAHIAPWDNHTSISTFPSALNAVQELSYGSITVRHTHSIDDVQIANNIAHSADGEKTASYNFLWSWEDTVGEIQRHLDRKVSVDSSRGGVASLQGIGKVIGGLCVCDNESQLDIVSET